MEDRQLKAIDARIKYIARIFDLEPFIVQRPERKIMKRFLQGIGATLLVIGLGFGGFKAITTIAEYERAKEVFKDTHFNVHINCTNCDRRHHPDFEKGKIVQNSTYECWDCGMVGKLNKAKDKSYVYYHLEREK